MLKLRPSSWVFEACYSQAKLRKSMQVRYMSTQGDTPFDSTIEHFRQSHVSQVGLKSFQEVRLARGGSCTAVGRKGPWQEGGFVAGNEARS